MGIFVPFEFRILGGEGEMSNQELKPCPFCQQPLKVVDGDIFHPFSWCILGGVSFPVENATTWNTRTPDPLLEELADALGKLLFECDDITNTCKPTRTTYNHGFAVLQKYQQSKVQP